MGCSMCNIIDKEINNSNFFNLKNLLNDEYLSYLSFINKIKTDLNSSIYHDKGPNNNQDNINRNNEALKREFNLIPRNWFDNWEKTVKYVVQNNKYKSYNFDFKYKDIGNYTNFYYDIMTNDLWSIINKNKIYNLNVTSKKKMGVISNNLIIFQHSKKINMIEIFFFQNEDDLFFTNLLFSFEKCENAQTEAFNLFILLKTSPIQEIFGNMHYDYSKQKFIEKKKNIIIYNKTNKVNEDIKTFRKIQYEKIFKNSQIKEKENDETEKIIEMKDNKSEIENENDYPINSNNKFINFKLNHFNKNREESTTKNDITKASGLMLMNNQNLISNNTINNISSIKIYHSKNDKNYKNSNDNINDDVNNNCQSNISPFKKDLLLNNIYLNYNQNSNKHCINNIAEISTILVNKNKGTSNYGNLGEDLISQNLFECILYCFFNVKELTTYILNNKENIENNKENNNNRFINNFTKIIQFISNKNNIIKNEDIYNISNLRNNLLKNCPNYNFPQLIDLIIFQNSNNIISKIINLLHFELNKSNKKEELKYNISQNDISDENIYKNEEEKKQKYNTFLKESIENNKSIIFNLFYGIKEIKIICNNCNKSKYKYELMNIVELPIEKLNIFYYEKQKHKNANNKLYISLEDCLNYYKKVEKKNTLFNCLFCNEYQNYSIMNDICKYPEIFIIYFYNNNASSMDTQKYDHNLKIKISTKIELLKDKYELIGIISLKNIKDNNEESKYIAYLNILTHKKWIYFDDNEIDEFNLDKNIDNINPIALFYQIIKE